MSNNDEQSVRTQSFFSRLREKAGRTRLVISVIAVLVVVVVISVFLHEAVSPIITMWRKQCAVSTFFKLNSALERYEDATGSLPPMSYGDSGGNDGASWRVEIFQWIKERSTSAQSPNANVWRKITGDNFFTCSGFEDGRDIHVFGIFTSNGEWAFKSDLQSSTPLANYVLIMMPASNYDWTKPGDLILKQDGSVQYYSPPSTRESVNITGCIALDAVGNVEIIE